MATTNEERLYPIDDLSAGMQRRTTRFLAQQSEVRLLVNGDLRAMIGGITKCLGYTQKGLTINSAGAVLGAGSLNTSSGTNKLLAFSGTDAYIYNSGTGAWDAGSRTYTAAQRFETIRFLEQLFIINGLTDVPENYNGSDFSTTRNVSDMPKAKYGVEDRGRIFLFNVNIPVGGSFPSRVFYSDLPINNALTWGIESGTDLAQTAASAVVTSAGSLFITRNIKIGDTFIITTGTNAGEYVVRSVDSETQITLTKTLTNSQSSKSFWVGGNFFDVARDNSDVGMGIISNFDRVILFKRFSLSIFNKTADVATDSLIPVKGAPGTVSHRSIVNIGQWTFYFSDQGVQRFDGVESLLISDPIQEIIDGIPASALSTIASWSVSNRILKIYVGDVSNSDTGLEIPKCVICHDTRANSWWVESIEDAINCRITWVEDSAFRNFIFSSAGLAHQTEVGNSFNTVAIQTIVESQPFFIISPDVYVNLVRGILYGRRISNATIQYKFLYKPGEENDAEWKKSEIKHKTDNEIQFHFPTDTNKAAGIELRVSDIGTTRMTFEKFTLFYSGGDLR